MRRALRDLGVRFGAFTIYVTDVVAPETRWLRDIFADLAAPDWRPQGSLAALPRATIPKEALAYRGQRALAGCAADIEALERIGDIARAAEAGFRLSKETLDALGWSAAQAERVLRALSFIPAGKAEGGLWRRRGPPSTRPAAPVVEAPPSPGPQEPCRIDVWLWRARFCKTRALAAKRVAEGEVRVARSGEQIVVDKPSRNIRPGDVLILAFGGRNAHLRVEGIGDRRGPSAEARVLYTRLDA